MIKWTNTHPHAILQPIFQIHLVSQCSHVGETYWNNHWIFYEPDVLPATQTVMQNTTGKPSVLVVFCFTMSDMVSAPHV